ncbi:hypothetical protein HUF15_13495 [Streptomyces samsunensis]|uniref:Uncharacterized protein n=2 Tax=Streptomyces TaxID=1883 RepID=A0ABX6WDT1_STRMQ|nr:MULTISPECIES: hypothetical protein [Streptomyces]MYU12509.1 hypothetical protein [Streptomyces sp. SID8361]AQA15041.1 hypothetical protein BV401_36190 [Streptomyces autolyticus]ATL86673.1 hypothetical protein SMALA_6445 [Streptomyces malaysiensis]MCD9587826.1 hypothetical protein [Streptomyces sp. 8ZJF_21]MCM3805251.1 hypothetical protein [Streptomyces sp. DR7-3]
MADTAGRTTIRTRRRGSVDAALDAFGGPQTGTRHPLVAAAMVLPMAILLTITFGGWDAVVTQASSVAGMLGR